MKKKFTEEQIIKILSRNRGGEKIKELGREFGITPATTYVWKKKFSNMTVSEAKRFRELEAENGKLKRIVADQALSIVMLKDVNSKKW
jgi:putative transposase